MSFCASDLWVLLEEADLHEWASVHLEGDRSPLKERTYHHLPQWQVAMDSRQWGHAVCPTHCLSSPPPSEKNVGVFMRDSVHWYVQEWCGNCLKSSFSQS